MRFVLVLLIIFYIKETSSILQISISQIIQNQLSQASRILDQKINLNSSV
jgi:hypothetical protein